MILHSGPGFVLRRQRSQENDLRLTLLLRDLGKIFVLAKGGLKFGARLKALQEPFTEADFQISITPHGHYGRLIGGKLIRSHQALARNWSVFMTANRCSEVVESLLPFRAPSPEVFDILRMTFHALGIGATPSVQWILFGTRLLHCLGYGDVSREVLKLLQPRESAQFASSLLGFETDLAWNSVTEPSLNRCQALLDARISQLLPWPLKSESLISL